nr:hypothetical protein BaRGS_027072 [Batillaria attramentaria]
MRVPVRFGKSSYLPTWEHTYELLQSAGGDGSVDKVGSADSTAADGLSKLLVNIFPLLRMMQVQGQWNKVQEIHLVPMAAAFDLCLVVAPPIVYDNPMEGQVERPVKVNLGRDTMQQVSAFIAASQPHRIPSTPVFPSQRSDTRTDFSSPPQAGFLQRFTDLQM